MSSILDTIIGADPSAAETDLTLTANGQSISGWEDISVTLQAEAFPNSFEISMSGLDPSTGADLVVRPGDACQVKLGKAIVVTGYIDRVTNGGDAHTHTLQISGRGKCQDLVDCSAEWPSGQISEANVFDIATKLAQPYGITVKLGEGADAGPNIPQFNLNYGETAADIIQRLAHNAGLLAYEDSNGNLILGAIGSKTAASGAIYGGNVESWSCTLSMDQRFSEIVCAGASQNILSDLGDSGFFFDTETDPNVPRHRRMYMINEMSAMLPQEFTKLKAKWEIARRAGRGTDVTLQIDSWKDSSGALWAPNTLIPVTVPGLPAASSPLCISSVTFRKGSDGTHADLQLLPPAAFSIEPIVLFPLNISDIQPAS